MPTAIYVFGGHFSSFRYEYLPTNGNEWQQGSRSIPGGFRYGCGVRLNDNELALVGEIGTKSRVMKFNTATEVFTENWGTLKQPRRNHACVPLKNQILVVGGFSGSQHLASSEFINISDGQAGMSVGDLNTARRNFGLVSLGGNSKKVIAFGGRGPDGNWLDSV